MPNHVHGIIFINQPYEGGSDRPYRSETFAIKPIGGSF